MKKTVRNTSSKFTDIFTWPEFRVVWVLLALMGVAFAVDVVAFPDTLLLFVEGGVLFLAFFIAAGLLYRSAKTDRDTKIERSELSGILESMDDAIVVYEEGFRAIFFNAAAERLFHVESKAVVGHVFSPRDVEIDGWRTLIQVIFPSLAPRVVSRSQEGAFPQVVDLSFTDPDLELRVTTAPLADDTGKRIAFMKIVRNRTTLITALRSKSEFVTIASHQFRTPVTEITWALESLANSAGINDSDKAILQNALAASKGLARRIEDLLSIAKMEDGQFGYAFTETNVVDFVGKVLGDIMPSAQTAGVKIYFDRPAGEIPHAMIDQKQLSLALVNLLENAIRYNVQNGEVTVKVDAVPNKPFIALSVKDTGIGIPPEDMAKLFNKFYRAENAMKLQTEGSGLGLYIAKGIVKAHGGELWVESELNRGTTMTLTIPTDPNLVPQHEVGSEYLL